ncbi:MAG: methionine aminotransferase [Acidobacteria bacterium RIFCSPLOWO2_02_FULL_67_36]|nr:MAG: methionine aminotransferase [Acidobacteria bacterium RIFCSPLOWO2_02_FULL_67_36]OFW18961.1 MAG: methionine aminotransferase [Acidobacteria bacterium RIFCSPLOWO2_12_FULL_66_21]
MTVSLQSKLPSVGTTIFTVMSRMAAELGAINLSQGFPDFDCDPELIDAVAGHMRAGRNQYAPMQGILPLREAIAAKYEHFHGRRYDPETEVTVTSGGTEALFDAIAAVLHPGDEAIVLEPCYDSYVPAIELSGGVPIVVSLTYPDYAIDWPALRRAVTPRTRLLIVNSPHNPAGAVLDAADIRELTALVAERDLLIVADEVYEHIIFDGIQHESMARHPELAARSFIIGSFGKTYHTTGWKVGYTVAPAPLTAEFRKVHQFVTFATNTPVQYALADFLAARRGLAELSPFYQRKRDLFLRLMEGSRFTPLACRGSYFQLMDYSAITDEDDAAFAVRLTREHGVASIPTSPFLYRSRAPKVLRFCFAKREETLAAAAERLRGV